MKNLLVVITLSLVASFAFAGTASFTCQQLADQPQLTVRFDGMSQILTITKAGTTQTFKITRIAAGNGIVDTVLIGESKQAGELQMNLGPKVATIYQISSDEIDYVSCQTL